MSLSHAVHNILHTLWEQTLGLGLSPLLSHRSIPGLEFYGCVSFIGVVCQPHVEPRKSVWIVDTFARSSESKRPHQSGRVWRSAAPPARYWMSVTDAVHQSRAELYKEI